VSSRASNGARQPLEEGFVRYERKRGWSALELRELWKYRELLYFLTWRTILVRYKQAVIGVAWAALNPLLTMAFVGNSLEELASSRATYNVVTMIDVIEHTTLPLEALALAASRLTEGVLWSSLRATRELFHGDSYRATTGIILRDMSVSSVSAGSVG
jgi:hypothetical protein